MLGVWQGTKERTLLSLSSRASGESHFINHETNTMILDSKEFQTEEPENTESLGQNEFGCDGPEKQSGRRRASMQVASGR